jgi:hypothetical protein
VTKSADPKHIPHKGKNTAYHMEWEFRPEAAVWIGKRPVKPNFHPLATDLYGWLLRESSLWALSPEEGLFTNPYTCDASILSVAFAAVVNDCAEFSKSTEPLRPLDAEVKCIRLYTEYVLYMARLSEAFIKQLLFCTSFVEGNYKGAALGSLLSKDCNGCQSSKDKRHKLSLIGSLAHRYRLCHSYEGCLSDHMKIVNRRRDVEAAHSGVTKFAEGFRHGSVSEMRSEYEKELLEMGNDFVHMLKHISEIEEKMLTELNALISEGAQRVCPVVQMAKGQGAAGSAARSSL